jgi:hypothetical protein
MHKNLNIQSFLFTLTKTLSDMITVQNCIRIIPKFMYWDTFPGRWHERSRLLSRTMQSGTETEWRPKTVKVNILGKRLYTVILIITVEYARIDLRYSLGEQCRTPHLTFYRIRKAIVVYYETSVTSCYTTYHMEEGSNLLNYATHLEGSYAWPILTHGGRTESCYIHMDVSMDRNEGGSISLKF